jgi:parvulin-like peptidyl-prolyl isomerase
MIKKMPNSDPRIQALRARYAQYAEALPATGPICQGTVIKRDDVRERGGKTKIYGPYYLWTRKVKGKTLSIAISQQQYSELKQAIANQNKLDKILAQMRSLTEEIIFTTTPGVKKRKWL